MPKRSFLSALFYSIRPSACLGVALFATAGLGQWNNFFVVSLTFLCGFIGGAGCFLINDIFDREKDLKNNKQRPIATGELSVRTALVISVICCLFMLVGAYFLHFHTFIAAALLIAGFWSYSYINQHFGLLANMWVSACSALAFLCGAMVYDITPLIYLAMFTTLFVNAGREILLDALDQEGDKAVGKPSIPLIFGETRTVQIVAVLYMMGSVVALTFAYFFSSAWPWMLSLMLVVWVPFFLKPRAEFRKWALFNVRTSHLFFAILIILLFIRP